MSERLALMQLQIELRRDTDTARDAWRSGLTFLKFDNTLLENRVPSSTSQARTGEQFVDALHELSEPAAPANKPRPGEVAPIEKLDLLIRLSQSSRRPDEQLLMVEIAKSLLAPAARNDAAQLNLFIEAIDRVPKGQQVIRMPVLGDDMGLARIEGRRAPSIAAKPKTVAEVLRLDSVAPRVKLANGLADHPVVVVEACIYKAMVGDEAEYPVHLRTTISYGPPKTVAKFKDLLDPGRWPDYNSFWAEMTKVPPQPPVPPPQAGANVPKNTPPPNATPEQAAAIRANSFVKHVESIQWHSVGTFHEKVGFDSGGGPIGGHPGRNNQGRRDLFPDTFLYFSRANGTAKQDLLTYTLLGDLPPLCVDDGCIEVKKTNNGVDVITTKSLYVDGQGSRTELSGILAYMAAYSGWGANTLVLVSNAAKK